jgi:hypothetical protein
MPTITITTKEIINLIDQLDFQNKGLIFDHLKSEILEQRWDALFTRIDNKLEEFPITDEEIETEVERAREEFAKSGH